MPDRAILFADVCNSTGITERLGDVESRRVIAGILEGLGDVTAEHGGAVIKTIGDEIMSAFPDAFAGVSAAVGMQRRMNSRPPVEGMTLAVRIGVHWGPVVEESDDVFGDVVNVAARVVALSAADQILTTEGTVAASGQPVPHRSLGVHGVRGRDEQLHLCEILWRGETSQMTVVAPKLDLGPRARLEVSLGSESRTLDSNASDALSIGRGAECDLVVPSAQASRAHADIVCRAGRFYLDDHSTNGTYLKPETGREMFVHRDQVPLQGAGMFRLGEPVAVKGPLDIEYRTVYQD